MAFQYNFHKEFDDLNLYYCDVCGAPILGAGKVELFYWVESHGKRRYTKVRRCEDCTREEIACEINGYELEA